MNTEEKIRKIISSAVSKAGYPQLEEDIVLEMPSDSSKGDYSTNLAMRMASRLGTNPFEIAENISKNIEKDDDIEKIEAVRPGFLNIFLSNRCLLTELSKIVEKEDEYFRFENKKNTNVIIEYTDANPFKVLHIGHLYTNIVGESFARLQEALGANVKRANYQGDVGLHVAKTLWALEVKMKEDGITFEEIETWPLENKVRYLGKSYIYGSQQYDTESDKSAIKDIDDINYFIYSNTVPSLGERDFSKYESLKTWEKYTKSRQWCLDYFEIIYKKLGTKLDYYFFESEVGESGLKLVLENVGKIFKQDGPSIIYEGQKEKGLHTRVFVNQYGVPTYEAKELGLAFRKRNILDFDESIVITANEQMNYFKVVFDALAKIDPTVASKTRHVSHGMILASDGKKMGSRKGGFSDGESLLSFVEERVKELVIASKRIADENVDDVSEKIAVAAIKYAFLKVGVGKNIVFDIEKSISFDGDTGPYLLYVYSRCNSIIEEVDSLGDSNLCLELCLDNQYTKELVRSVGKAKDYMLTSALNYSPSLLCHYLFELGQVFSNFYQNVRVLDADEEERKILLLLLKAVMITMRVGLYTLGIKVVDRM
ncbi:arginine--tRNA ligase [Candidatus Microgenomates bacterium]|nr:arginine--tRNA ligase [Candidatus Microgenomates bacterium]